MSNVSDKSFTYRSYPKLAYGSINVFFNSFQSMLIQTVKYIKLEPVIMIFF